MEDGPKLLGGACCALVCSCHPDFLGDPEVGSQPSPCGTDHHEGAEAEHHALCPAAEGREPAHPEGSLPTFSAPQTMTQRHPRSGDIQAPIRKKMVSTVAHFCVTSRMEGGVVLCCLESWRGQLLGGLPTWSSALPQVTWSWTYPIQARPSLCPATSREEA